LLVFGPFFRSKLLIDGSQQQAGHLLGSTRTLVEQMRSVYGTGRPLFRLSLQQPLFVLSVLHSIHGHEAAAAQVLEEIVSDCLTPPFAYIDGPTVHILLVSRHLAAGNRRLAQKVGGWIRIQAKPGTTLKFIQIRDYFYSEKFI
jgi:hypothetical protein